jgi:uncharacterized protein YecE (DUF72 family)
MNLGPGMARIGIAGWSLPLPLRQSTHADLSLLEQYGHLFDVVEINSSFYRLHRLATYQRWAASVPAEFRFSVKLPKLITHEKRLVGCKPDLDEFMGCVHGLGEKLGVWLVQLPPSAALERRAAQIFFAAMRRRSSRPIACEPRHPSWFTGSADKMFEEFGVTRVLADPVPRGCEINSARGHGFAYMRLHGSPRMYYSAYSTADLQARHACLLTPHPEVPLSWCIFDNTAAGAAWSDAQAMQRLLHSSGSTRAIALPLL